MKVIVAGSRPPKEVRQDPLLLRDWNMIHFHVVAEAVSASGYWITEVVSGKAQGFDTLGEYWARAHKIPIKPFPAEWRTRTGDFNRGAGHDRNQKMGDYADALIAITYGTSGTAHMIAYMRRLGKLVYVMELTGGLAAPAHP